MTQAGTVRVGELDVRFRLDGPPDAPVVLLAHGLLANLQLWDGFVAALRGRWQLLRYDLRGHGGTNATPAPYAMERLADDAVDLLDALQVGRAHFIGTSLGGMLGQQLGARHGSRFRSLTLANTTAVQGTPAAWQQRIDTARRHGVHAVVEPTLARWFTAPFLSAGHLVVARARAAAESTPLEGFVGCASAVRDLAQAALLPLIGCPTLVIVGQHDAATPPAEGAALQGAIAGSHLTSLPAAHQAVAEAPEAFAAAWETFMNDRRVQETP